MINNTDVPIWEKYTLTIEEASKYFRIGEKKLRKLAEENLDAGWVIVNGNLALRWKWNENNFLKLGFNYKNKSQRLQATY